MTLKINNRANILTENIVFILLNLVFLSILILFLVSKMSSVGVMEERYAKEIALLIDASEDGMFLYLNMEDAIKEAVDGGLSEHKIVSIKNNVVNVKLKEGVGFSYSFFNDVHVKPYLNTDNNKEYVFVIGG